VPAPGLPSPGDGGPRDRCCSGAHDSEMCLENLKQVLQGCGTHGRGAFVVKAARLEAVSMGERSDPVIGVCVCVCVCVCV